MSIQPAYRRVMAQTEPPGGGCAEVAVKQETEIRIAATPAKYDAMSISERADMCEDDPGRPSEFDNSLATENVLSRREGTGVALPAAGDVSVDAVADVRLRSDLRVYLAPHEQAASSTLAPGAPDPPRSPTTTPSLEETDPAPPHAVSTTLLDCGTREPEPAGLEEEPHQSRLAPPAQSARPGAKQIRPLKAWSETTGEWNAVVSILSETPGQDVQELVHSCLPQTLPAIANDDTATHDRLSEAPTLHNQPLDVADDPALVASAAPTSSWSGFRAAAIGETLAEDKNSGVDNVSIDIAKQPIPMVPPAETVWRSDFTPAELERHQHQSTLNCEESHACQQAQLTRFSSRFKGVFWDKAQQKWVTQLFRRGKQTIVFVGDDEEKAARAWDEDAAEQGRTDLNFRISSGCQPRTTRSASNKSGVAELVGQAGAAASQVPARSSSTAHLLVNSRVRVRFSHPKGWFAGRVKTIVDPNRFEIEFDDGDELTVHSKHIELLEKCCSTGPVDAASSECMSEKTNSLTVTSTTCLICLENFYSESKQNSQVCMLPCQHSFCAVCIEKWCSEPSRSGRPTCPQCRKGFASLRHCPRVAIDCVVLAEGSLSGNGDNKCHDDIVEMRSDDDVHSTMVVATLDQAQSRVRKSTAPKSVEVRPVGALGVSWTRYNSIAAAARSVSTSTLYVSECCRSLRQSAKGHEFRFADGGKQAEEETQRPMDDNQAIDSNDDDSGDDHAQQKIAGKSAPPLCSTILSPKGWLLRRSSRNQPAEPAQIPDDPEKQREDWIQLVRKCCATVGREENNIKAYIGNAVLNRQVAALGETIGDVLSAARKETIGADDRAKVTKLLQAARDKIEPNDNGSKAAFSAVNQVYGTDSMFAVPLPFSPPATRSAKPKQEKGWLLRKRKAPAASSVREAKNGSCARTPRPVESRPIGATDASWIRHETISDAARSVSVDKSCVSKCCRMLRQSVKGHEFRYMHVDSGQRTEAVDSRDTNDPEVQRQQEQEEEVACTKDEGQDTEDKEDKEDKEGGTEDKEEMQVALACVDSEEDTENNIAAKSIEDYTTEEKSESDEAEDDDDDDDEDDDDGDDDEEFSIRLLAQLPPGLPRAKFEDAHFRDFAAAVVDRRWSEYCERPKKDALQLPWDPSYGQGTTTACGGARVAAWARSPSTAAAGEMQQHEHPLRKVSIETEVGTIKVDDLLFVRCYDGDKQFYPAKVIIIDVVPLKRVLMRHFNTADSNDCRIYLSIADITRSRVRLSGYYHTSTVLQVQVQSCRYKYSLVDVGCFLEEDTTGRVHLRDYHKYSFADVGWFQQEDTKLLQLVARFGEEDWPATARLLGTFHTADECFSRYRHLQTDEALCAQKYRETWQGDLVSSRNKRQLNLLTKCGGSAKRSKISPDDGRL